MIPPILHYVWVGGPLPAAQAAYIDTWRETNPTFQIVCWNEDNIDMSSPIIKSAYAQKKWAKVADVARLQAVQKMGGIYLDTDFKLFKPLDWLCNYNCFYAFQESEDTPDWVCNGAFGAEPNHWFINLALEGLYAMPESRLRFLERPTQFGPKHITKLLRAQGLDHYDPNGQMLRDIFIAPVPVFFPFHHTETFSPECITDQTVAAHFWEKSWEHSIPLPLRLARNLRQHLRMLAKTRIRSA